MRFVLLILLFSSLGWAQRIDIETEEPSNLEIRNVTLPDGVEAVLYVVQGSPVRVSIGDDTITAELLEFDFENDLVRIIGPGTFVSGTETIQGEDFSINLDDEAFQGQDVLILTGEVDVLGADVTRIPGRIDVVSGAFSPCERCSQRVQDYGFRARRLQLYPGDRLIAFDVTVLIREEPVFYLPLLILPLGPEERRPRFAVSAGTEDKRAEVALDWPFVVGASAFGTSSLRYYADVDPGDGDPFSNLFLGGQVETSYLGGGVDLTFFTETGEGSFEVFYLPSFIDPDTLTGKTQDEFLVRFRYDTLPDLAFPEINLVFERDDGRRQRLVEYRFGVRTVVDETLLGGLEARFLSQGFFDLEPDDFVTPSYAGGGIPRRTYLQLTLTPDIDTSFSIGPFVLSQLLVDIGVFEGSSNPLNRSAALERFATAGRLLESHTLALEPVNPWAGLTLSAGTTFTGRYYTTDERLVDWDSFINVRQAFGDAGSLNVTFVRDISEGETPFAFDRINLFNQTYLDTALILTPFPWLRFGASERYTFVNNRQRGEVGPGPLDLTLDLFDNLNWLDITIANSYDFAENDPGELELLVALRSPEPEIGAALTITHLEDLKATPDRLSGDARDESRTEVEAVLGYGLLAFDFQGGYLYDPPEPDEEDEPFEYWLPLELGVTLGTAEQTDLIPGFRFAYERDLNREALRELGFEFYARYGAFEVALEERFNLLDDRLSRGVYILTWRGVAAFEASGFALLPSSLLGIDLDPDASQNWAFSLRDAAENANNQRWRVTYRTELNQTATNRFGEPGGFRNSRLEALVNIDGVDWGGVDFGINFSADLRLADDFLATTYLQRLGLSLSADFFGRVGLQGDVSYLGSYSEASGLTSARLTFSELALTVRVLDDLYVAGILDDTWNLVGDNPAESPFNFQPTLYVVWDRCCWALYGSVDTGTGALSIAIGAPGGGVGFEQEFDTFIRFPGRSPITDTDPGVSGE